ncbi:MAG: hypothetical protein JXR37_13180 [Kiritimatiellae bacterium]|nr:hypothetical protein [Kiritimatiellia bacterium]
MKRQVSVFLAAGVLLSHAACAAAVTSIPQEHDGHRCVQPEQFDIWAGLPTRQYLNGVWKLVKFEVKQDAEVAELATQDMAWWRSQFAAKGRPQLVPMEWHQNYAKGDAPHPTARAGLYGLQFSPPPNSRDRRAILHFDRLLGDAQIYVNGEQVYAFTPLFRAGSGGVSFLEAVDIDITRHLRLSAMNELDVRLLGAGERKARYSERMEPSPTGIGGPVWIDYRPHAFVSELYLAPNTRTSVLSVELVRDAGGAAGAESNWRIRVEPWDAGSAARRYEQACTIRWQDDRARLELGMDGAVCWAPENPFLYKIEIRDEHGEVVARDRFGFRTFVAQGDKFLLNGRPVWLRGILASGATRDGKGVDASYNHNEHMRDWLTLMRRDAHVNHMRIHSGSHSSIFFDICDELGLLISDEIRAPSHLLKADDPRRRADYIAVKHVKMFFDPNGAIRPESLRLFSRLVKHTHNHPSVVMYTAGNENAPAPFFYKYARAFYETVHETDRQDRPVSSWGSGPHLERAKTCEEIPTDYFDFHNYDETLAGGSWLDTRPAQYREVESSRKKAHLGSIPFVNGETIGQWIREHATRHWYERAATGLTPRDMFLEWVRTKGAYNDNQFNFHSRILGRIGIRAHTSQEAFRRAHAASTKQLLETQRRELDFISGILLLGGETNEHFIREMGAAYQPLWICAYPFDLNHFPGDRLELDVLLHNGTVTPAGGLTAEATVLGADGSTLGAQAQRVSVLQPDERRKAPFSVALPAAARPRRAVLRLALRDGNGERARNDYAIRLLPARVPAPARSVAQPLLYEKPGREQTTTVAALLRAARVPFTALHSLDTLPAGGTLIIGPDSLDEHAGQCGAKLNAWLKGGGRLLVFEQRRDGALPFLPEYRLTKARPRPFADPLVLEHPAFTGLDEESFRDWDGTGTLYDHWVNRGEYDVDESILISAGQVWPGWSREKRKVQWGMLAAEIKVGRGAVFLSQVRALEFYARDRAANRYVDNLLRYAIGPEFGGKWAIAAAVR